MSKIQERGSTHVYKINKISKEEMDKMVNLCVYEQPAYCNAACPLKLDTKALMKAIADNDFKKALSIYEKAAIFPYIVSVGCDAPCEGKCKLAELGDGVAIRDIEVAVAAFGEKGRSGGVFRTKKKKTSAVIGSGLFPLFLAGELEKKNYPVTVFCQEAGLEAYLRTAAGFLDDIAFFAELDRLKSKDITFEFSREINAAIIADIREKFDVVCVEEGIIPDAEYDKALMYCEKDKLVIGGGEKVIDAAFGAKKAALTVDRLAQNLDPRNTRGEEGACETRLYTDPGDAKELIRVKAANCAYSREEAAKEASRCMQCHCEECLKSCAYLKHYKKHPGLLAREIYNNTQIIMGDHQLNKPMNACSLCGQCSVVCPNGLDMAKVCKTARENMVSTDKMPLAPHEFALMDMFFSNEESYLCRKQPGHDNCKYVFFPGCQAIAIAPETVRAAYEDLCARLEGGVALMLGCCGIIADWAGRIEMYYKTREFIDSELSKLGDPTVISACPSCKKALESHGKGISVIGIWDILADIGLPAGAKKLDRPAAMHDSCGARGDAHIQESVRVLAEKLGCELVETDYTLDEAPCCGYGGLSAYANRDVAREMTQKCLERSDAPYITYCMACRDRFAREGRETRHILELVYGTDAGSPPDISEKRYNRLNLKNQLLRELWNEEAEEVELPFMLEYTAEALAMMDDRMILKGDVIAVMQELFETGEAVEDAESGYLICRKRCGNVTFWVAYTETDGGYLVHRAYSHRMNVMKRIGE